MISDRALGELIEKVVDGWAIDDDSTGGDLVDCERECVGESLWIIGGAVWVLTDAADGRLLRLAPGG